MIRKALSSLFTVVGVMLVTNANANSVSFDENIYFPVDTPGQIVVTVNYDFFDFAMFGGGMDLFYNSDLLEFVSYTRSSLAGSDAQDAASPLGELAYEGSYVGFGIGTFEFFNGMFSAGSVGVFVFNTLGDSSSGVGPVECGGFALCLLPNEINPMVSLAGEDVTFDIFGEGTQAEVQYETPIPGAMWLLASGIGLLGFLRRKK